MNDDELQLKYSKPSFNAGDTTLESGAIGEFNQDDS
jgi:hypothetical protein